MPKTYRVSICRTSYAHKEFVITTDSKKEAERIALDMAGNYEFAEKDAEYSAEHTQVIKES